KPSEDVKDKAGEVVIKAGKKITRRDVDLLDKHKVREVEIDVADLEGAYFAEDIVTDEGEIVAEVNTEIDAKAISGLSDAGVASFRVFIPERDEIGVILSQTLKKDGIKEPSNAILEIYRKMRPGDPPTIL